MRRICRIGPIYGATCHRSGFRCCEISPAMVPCGTRNRWEKKRDSVLPLYSAWNPGRRERKKLMRRIKRSTSRRNSRWKRYASVWLYEITAGTRWISMLSPFTFRFSSQSFGLVSKSNIPLHNYLENRFGSTNFENCVHSHRRCTNFELAAFVLTKIWFKF